MATTRATLYVRDLPDDLVRAVKVLAAKRGTTVRDVVAEALEATVRDSVSRPVEVPYDLQADIAWYESNRETMMEQHPGEFLAIVDQRVVDHDADFAALAERTLQRYDRPVLMPDTRRQRRTVHLRTPRAGIR